MELLGETKSPNGTGDTFIQGKMAVIKLITLIKIGRGGGGGNV